MGLLLPFLPGRKNSSFKGTARVISSNPSCKVWECKVYGNPIAPSFYSILLVLYIVCNCTVQLALAGKILPGTWNKPKLTVFEQLKCCCESDTPLDKWRVTWNYAYTVPLLIFFKYVLHDWVINIKTIFIQGIFSKFCR